MPWMLSDGKRCEIAAALGAACSGFSASFQGWFGKRCFGSIRLLAQEPHLKSKTCSRVKNVKALSPA